MMAGSPKNGPTRQHGVTLVELMVGLVVGSLVVLAITTVYIITVGASNATLSSVRLNQDLRSTMLIISSEIRRAGYWNQDIRRSSPFTAESGQGFQLSNCNDNNINCTRVDYAFDRDRDGLIAENEEYGFRFVNNKIQMINPSDDVTGEWIDLLGGAGDPVDITRLYFSPINYQCINVSAGDDRYIDCDLVTGDPGDSIQQKRRIQVVIEGTIGDQIIILDETIRIRNDRQFIRQ